MTYQIPYKFIEAFSRPCFVPAVYHTINISSSDTLTFDNFDSKVGGIRPFLFKQERNWPVCKECGRQWKISQHPLFVEKTGGIGLFQLFVCLSCEEQEISLDKNTYLARLVNIDEVLKEKSSELTTQEQIATAHMRSSTSPESPSTQIKPPIPGGDVLVLDECLILDWDQCQEIPHIYDIEESDTALKYLELERHDSQLDEICEHRLHPKPGTFKVFGWPYWIQAADYPKCKEAHCGRSMHCLLQLAESGIISYMWGDCGIASVFQCPSHQGSFYFMWESS
ncbi:hypothetical protein K7432_008652 [Basidiobolus ranarum]|uniref:Uncharacterized protein n=1 Tax=Basidiobolus ranarum TaxID=34480 RepID=A0ABR2VY85_9FUNG